MRAIAWACAAWCCLSFGCQSRVATPEDRSVIIYINARFEPPYCPIISGVSAAPLEVVIGGEIRLHAEIEAGLPSILWRSSSAASWFDDASALDTSYHCVELGEQLLTLDVAGTGKCGARAELPVTCSRSPACGDGVRNAEEQCDDGDSEPFDGCSELCRFEVQ